MKKLMKSGCITILSAGMLVFGQTAFAAGKTVDVAAGLTPDSPFYFLDRWQEDLQLFLAGSPAKKAELFAQDAQERIAETSVLAAKHQTKAVGDLIKTYFQTMDKAQQNADKVITDTNEGEQTKKTVMNDLQEAASADKSVQNEMNTEEKDQSVQQKQEIVLKANVIQALNPETIKTLRDQGLGFGEIVKVVAIAKASGKQPSEIVSVIKDGHKGFGEIVKALGLNPSVMISHVDQSHHKSSQAMKKTKASEDHTTASSTTETRKSMNKEGSTLSDKTKATKSGNHTPSRPNASVQTAINTETAGNSTHGKKQQKDQGNVKEKAVKLNEGTQAPEKQHGKSAEAKVNAKEHKAAGLAKAAAAKAKDQQDQNQNGADDQGDSTRSRDRQKNQDQNATVSLKHHEHDGNHGHTGDQQGRNG